MKNHLIAASFASLAAFIGCKSLDAYKPKFQRVISRLSAA